MKGSGIFRGLAVRSKKIFTRTQQISVNEYPDPVMHKVLKRKKKRPTRRLAPPPCLPGTVTYRDALVRYLGYDRKKADKMLSDWRSKNTELPHLGEGK